MAISRTGKVAVPDKIGGLIANSASELGNFFGFRAMLNSKVSLLRMICGTASFYQKKLEGEKRKGGGDREERTPEMQVLYIILTLCASFLIFQLVRWYQRRWR